MSSPRRTLVIGGSIGGLPAANWLRAIGWDVAVCERVEADLASRGAGIGTHEDLLAGLRRLGLRVDASIDVQVRTRTGSAFALRRSFLSFIDCFFSFPDCWK